MSAFRQALEAGDLKTLRGMWAKIAPHLPQPQTEEQAEIVMHRARTEAESLTLKARAWSHRWLEERSLPSGLPDILKPKAERIYPRVVEAVGIAIKASSPFMRPVAAAVQEAMGEAVEDAYADGRKEPAFVTARMSEARARTLKALLGT